MPRGIYDRKAAREHRLGQSGKSDGETAKRKYTKRTPNLDMGEGNRGRDKGTFLNNTQTQTVTGFTSYITDLVHIRAALVQSRDDSPVSNTFTTIVHEVESEISTALTALRSVSRAVFGGGGGGGGGSQERVNRTNEVRGDEPVHFNPSQHNQRQPNDWRTEQITQ